MPLRQAGIEVKTAFFADRVFEINAHINDTIKKTLSLAGWLADQGRSLTLCSERLNVCIFSAQRLSLRKQPFPAIINRPTL